MFEAQFIETAILCILNHQTLIATKAAKILRPSVCFYCNRTSWSTDINQSIKLNSSFLLLCFLCRISSVRLDNSLGKLNFETKWFANMCDKKLADVTARVRKARLISANGNETREGESTDGVSQDLDIVPFLRGFLGTKYITSAIAKPIALSVPSKKNEENRQTAYRKI